MWIGQMTFDGNRRQQQQQKQFQINIFINAVLMNCEEMRVACVYARDCRHINCNCNSHSANKTNNSINWPILKTKENQTTWLLSFANTKFFDFVVFVRLLVRSIYAMKNDKWKKSTRKPARKQKSEKNVCFFPFFFFS